MADVPPESPADLIGAVNDAHRRWKRRVIATEDEVDPEQLMGHPANAKYHPSRQQKAMGALLDRVGWVSNVLVNQRTQCIIDGHMRVLLAISRGETVPVDYIDADPEEEALLLALYDGISRMAVIDVDMYQDLIDSVDDPGPAIAAAFADIMPGKPAAKDEAKEPTENDEALGDVIFGMMGWSETKVKASGEEIGDLTMLHQRYRAENSGNDEGFVQWLIQSHLD